MNNESTKLLQYQMKALKKIKKINDFIPKSIKENHMYKLGTTGNQTWGEENREEGN